MKYRVTILRKMEKSISKMPLKAQQRLKRLVMDLMESGPVQPGYMNYGRIGDETYHCHLTYHWVACWSCRKKALTVEVFYVGSRENAPY